MDSQVNIQLKTTATGTGAAQTAQGLQNVAKAAEQVNTASGKAAGSSKNLGNAMLQGSRAIQDMQFGLAGAVNNLEGIASALGLGAGVAGAVTVLAVLIQQVGPKVAEFIRSFDQTKTAEENLKKLKDQLGITGEAVDGVAIQQERFKQKLDESSDRVREQNDALETSINLLKLRAAAEKSQADYDLEVKIQDIKAQGLGADREAALIAEAKTAAIAEQLRRENDLARQQQTVRDTELINLTRAAEANAQRLAEQERILAATEQFSSLKEQELQLQKDLDAALKAAYDTELGQMETPRTEALRNQIAANQAGQAAAQTGGALGNVQAAAGNAATARAAARAAAEAAQRKAAENAAADAAAAFEAQSRFTAASAAQQGIARSQRGGVFGPNRVQTASPFGPAPLPGPSSVPMAAPASPFGPAPLPQAEAVKSGLQELNNTFASMAVSIAQLAQNAKTAERAVKNAR